MAGAVSGRSVQPRGQRCEFYVGNTPRLPESNGIGAEGQFNGSLAPDTWYRVAFAVDLAAPAGQQLTKYVNGAAGRPAVALRRR